MSSKKLNIIKSWFLESRRVLQTMSDEGVIVPTVVCLKSEDPECAYWAVALLHEFAINGKML